MFRKYPIGRIQQNGTGSESDDEQSESFISIENTSTEPFPSTEERSTSLGESSELSSSPVSTVVDKSNMDGTSYYEESTGEYTPRKDTDIEKERKWAESVAKSTEKSLPGSPLLSRKHSFETRGFSTTPVSDEASKTNSTGNTSAFRTYETIKSANPTATTNRKVTTSSRIDFNKPPTREKKVLKSKATMKRKPSLVQPPSANTAAYFMNETSHLGDYDKLLNSLPAPANPFPYALYQIPSSTNTAASKEPQQVVQELASAIVRLHELHMQKFPEASPSKKMNRMISAGRKLTSVLQKQRPYSTPPGGQPSNTVSFEKLCAALSNNIWPSTSPYYPKKGIQVGINDKNNTVLKHKLNPNVVKPVRFSTFGYDSNFWNAVFQSNFAPKTRPKSIGKKRNVNTLPRNKITTTNSTTNRHAKSAVISTQTPTSQFKLLTPTKNRKPLKTEPTKTTLVSAPARTLGINKRTISAQTRPTQTKMGDKEGKKEVKGTKEQKKPTTVGSTTQTSPKPGKVKPNDGRKKSSVPVEVDFIQRNIVEAFSPPLVSKMSRISSARPSPEPQHRLTSVSEMKIVRAKSSPQKQKSGPASKISHSGFAHSAARNEMLDITISAIKKQGSSMFKSKPAAKIGSKSASKVRKIDSEEDVFDSSFQEERIKKVNVVTNKTFDFVGLSYKQKQSGTKVKKGAGAIGEKNPGNLVSFSNVTMLVPPDPPKDKDFVDLNIIVRRYGDLEIFNIFTRKRKFKHYIGSWKLYTPIPFP